MISAEKREKFPGVRTALEAPESVSPLAGLKQGNPGVSTGHVPCAPTIHVTAQAVAWLPSFHMSK